jgi:hypothetical protein
MITIENVEKIRHLTYHPMDIITHQTHYQFNVAFSNLPNLEITLGRFTPLVQDGRPHPNRGKYLLCCQQELIWFTKHELRDIKNVMNVIRTIIKNLC